MNKRRAARLLSLIAAGMGAVVLAAGPAAAVDDSFPVSTGNGCGAANYVDSGPGASGGGDNDDYIVIHDYCTDHHGVKAWLNWSDADGNWLAFGDWQYNGNGLAGDPVIWDPFGSRTVKKGDYLDLRVCLVDGANDTSGSSCGEIDTFSADG
jgi:hypothetical protein